MFEHPTGGKEVGEQLLALRQGTSSVAEYALTFRTLAAQTGWQESPLKLLFRKGLNTDLQSELACRDEDKTLDQFIELAIRVDNVVRARRPFRQFNPTVAQTSETEPMQIGVTRVTHLSTEEKERRIQQNLCLYCGLPGHMRSNCPTRPSRRSTMVSKSAIQSTSFEIPVSVEIIGLTIHTDALIDSGAAGNFMDMSFAKTHHIPLVPCETHVAVAALDGRPLGSGQIQFITQAISLTIGVLHTETIRFFIFQSPRNPIILGLP